MNELLKMRLFSLLSEPSQVANEEMQNAYGCFMEQLRRVSQSENNIEVFRMLSFTRIELVALQTFYQHEQGGKCPKICLSKKSYPTS